MAEAPERKRVRSTLPKLSKNLSLHKSVTGRKQFYLRGTHDSAIFYLKKARRELAVITIPNDKTCFEIWSAELEFVDGVSTFFFVIENPRTKDERIGDIVRSAPATGDPELAERFRNLDPIKQLRQLGH